MTGYSVAGFPLSLFVQLSCCGFFGRGRKPWHVSFNPGTAAFPDLEIKSHPSAGIISGAPDPGGGACSDIGRADLARSGHFFRLRRCHFGVSIIRVERAERAGRKWLRFRAKMKKKKNTFLSLYNMLRCIYELGKFRVCCHSNIFNDL